MTGYGTRSRAFWPQQSFFFPEGFKKRSDTSMFEFLKDCSAKVWRTSGGGQRRYADTFKKKSHSTT